MASGLRVLISGAGIAGPILAWFLSRTGAHVTVVEKAKSILSHGQNVDFQGSAISVVEKMGLLKEIKRHNTTETGTQFIDEKGRPFASFPCIEGIGASPTNELEILRGDLAKILYKATKSHAKIKYMFDTTIERVLSNDDEFVRVKLSNGEVRNWDLLVAADGQWSKLRKDCFPDDLLTVVDKDMYCAYGTVPRAPSDNDSWNIYQALRSRILSVRPDPHGTMRSLLTIMPCNDIQRKVWKAASRSSRDVQMKLLRQEFSDAGWQSQRLLDAMERASDFYFQAVQQIRMSRWSVNRVVCLGDSAYAPTPLTGGGTSLALIGGCVLAGELNCLQKDDHISKALTAYERVYRPYVEEVQEMPSFIPSILHPETAWKRRIFKSSISTISWIVAFIVARPWLAQRLFSGDSKETFRLPKYATPNTGKD